MDTVAFLDVTILALVFMVSTILFMSIAFKKINEVRNLKWEISSLAVANKILKENINEMNKN